MKNSLFSSKNLFLAALLAAFSSQISAQSLAYRSNVSATVGPNYLQLFAKADRWLDLDSVKFGSINTYATPTFQLAYDYGFKDWFSLGLGVSYNRLGVKFDDLDYRSDSLTVKGSVDLRTSRTTITLRPLFHYGHFEKVDLYSGLRLGASIWTGSVKAEASAEAIDRFKKSVHTPRFRLAGGLPTAAITPIGVRYFPIPNLGVGGELNLGAPYMVSVSANFRF